MTTAISLSEKLAKFTEQWSPKIVAKTNDYHFKLVKEGEMFVIPKGAEHKTSAKAECCAMLVEIAGTVNTGDAGGDKTAPGDAWI